MPENVTRLTTTLEQYEAEIARVCAEVPQCDQKVGAAVGEFSAALHAGLASEAGKADLVFCCGPEMARL